MITSVCNKGLFFNVLTLEIFILYFIQILGVQSLKNCAPEIKIAYRVTGYNLNNNGHWFNNKRKGHTPKKVEALQSSPHPSHWRHWPWLQAQVRAGSWSLGRALPSPARPSSPTRSFCCCHCCWSLLPKLGVAVRGLLGCLGHRGQAGLDIARGLIS